MEMHASKVAPFLILAVCLGGIVMAAMHLQKRSAPGYQTIRLVQGARSMGMPLAGVAVDAERRDIFAIVGGDRTSGAGKDFVILWNGAEGSRYCATISREGKKLESIVEVRRDGSVQPLYDLPSSVGAHNREVSEVRAVSDEPRINPILEALAGNSDFNGK